MGLPLWSYIVIFSITALLVWFSSRSTIKRKKTFDGPIAQQLTQLGFSEVSPEETVLATIRGIDDASFSAHPLTRIDRLFKLNEGYAYRGIRRTTYEGRVSEEICHGLLFRFPDLAQPTESKWRKPLLNVRFGTIALIVMVICLGVLGLAIYAMPAGDPEIISFLCNLLIGGPAVILIPFYLAQDFYPKWKRQQVMMKLRKVAPAAWEKINATSALLKRKKHVHFMGFMCNAQGLFISLEFDVHRDEGGALVNETLMMNELTALVQF